PTPPATSPDDLTPRGAATPAGPMRPSYARQDGARLPARQGAAVHLLADPGDVAPAASPTTPPAAIPPARGSAPRTGVGTGVAPATPATAPSGEYTTVLGRPY